MTTPHDRASRILLVEGDREVAHDIAELLRRWGHDVVTAYDRRSAVDAAPLVMPEAVVVDTRLPGSDGYRVVSELGMLGGGERPLMIALTAVSGEEERLRSLGAGFDHVVVTPQHTHELLSILSRLGASAPQ